MLGFLAVPVTCLFLVGRTSPPDDARFIDLAVSSSVAGVSFVDVDVSCFGASLAEVLGGPITVPAVRSSTHVIHEVFMMDTCLPI